MLRSTAAVTSYTALVTPLLLVSFWGKVCCATAGGRRFILEGLVREVWRYVPLVRSMVRVL